MYLAVWLRIEIPTENDRYLFTATKRQSSTGYVVGLTELLTQIPKDTTLNVSELNAKIRTANVSKTETHLHVFICWIPKEMGIHNDDLTFRRFVM